MRIDVATANNETPKAIITRVHDAESADATALADAVAALDDDTPVAYRVADDDAQTREGAVAYLGKAKAPEGETGPWVFVTAGELEKLKPASVVTAAAKAKSESKKSKKR